MLNNTSGQKDRFIFARNFNQMNKLFYGLCLLISTATVAQIKGTVTDSKGITLPGVTIILEGTNRNTTSNEKGNYELPFAKTGTYQLVFQSLGFKTRKIPVNITSFPFEMNCQLQDENYILKEIVVSNKENPAHAIIRNAIAHKVNNTDKLKTFSCDFYSKGTMNLKDVPKKILGMKVEVNGADLDSTGSDMVYLSETFSRLQFQRPNAMKETIIASKMSGNNKGYSFNTAQKANYDFYENTINFENKKAISPLSPSAFAYYKFKFESSFVTADQQMVNKIKVIPRRDAEPVFEGYIYIVENSWALYAVDVAIKGYRMENPMIEDFTIKQSFAFDSQDNVWTKKSQILDFKVKIFGISIFGGYTYVYSNYDFNNEFNKKTFDNELVFIENDANKKADSYWEQNRPVPLTTEEVKDYVKKDSIETVRTSPKYLDSIDKKHNKLKPLSLLMGYNYQNSLKQWKVSYEGLASAWNFNTVQGFHFAPGISYRKDDEDKRRWTEWEVKANYGFSDQRFRPSFEFSKKLNNFNKATISVSGGLLVNQFNEDNPMNPLINSVSSLLFKSNFAKFYDKKFFKVSYGSEIINGIHSELSLEYSQRNPLFNATSMSWSDKEKSYTSNHPLQPDNFTEAIISKHNLLKLKWKTEFVFGQKYITRPDGKINLSESKYPVLGFDYQKGLLGNDTQNHFDKFEVTAKQTLALGHRGVFSYGLTGGTFLNAKNISFVDYKHFNGNQTYIGEGEKYLNVFNLMPYYQNSTKASYMEWHSEYDDKGFLFNKIPLLRVLKANMIMGFHQLNLTDAKPYQEVSIGLDKLGFGKFKMFRLDYVRSYQGGFKTDGVLLGLGMLLSK